MTAPHDASDPTAVTILNAALMHVPFDGWSDAALAAGAADAGVEEHLLSALFPRGAIDGIALHSRLADIEMVAAFHALPEAPQKIHLAIRALVLLRLELANQNKDAVRRALTMLALPAHAKLSAELLYETVDANVARCRQYRYRVQFLHAAGHIGRCLQCHVTGLAC